MGNVPAKEDRRGSVTSVSSSRRRASSIASTLQQASHNLGTSPFKINSTNAGLQKRMQEKEKLKEANAQGLIVRFDENVDGGYLSPYGTYNLNLDYKINVVKEIIIARKLAPFYTPLQDFNPNWTDTELLKKVDSLRLHAVPEDDEDDELAEVEESTLSKKELRKYLTKKFNKELKLKKLEWQKFEEDRYRKQRGSSRQASSRSLRLKLYSNCIECPICFLYYPKWINYSRCCNQAICSECFVQIKRLDPHYPHDTEEEIQNGLKNDPNLLISEPASCPYCATPNFGVTYEHPTSFRTGINGSAPSSFKSPSSSSIENAILEDEVDSNFNIQDNYFRKQSVIGRRGSLPANHPTVITTDYIRPDWESKLISARARLAKKAAAATAIHASNMIIQSDENDLEQKMIEEAMRLSLLDQAK